MSKEPIKPSNSSGKKNKDEEANKDKSLRSGKNLIDPLKAASVSKNDEVEKTDTGLYSKKVSNAFRLAEIHLKKFEKFNKNITRRISSINPIFEPAGKEPTIFEVTLQNEEGEKEGYILVSTSKNLPPIIKFSFTGKSDLEKLTEKAGSTDFVPVIYTPFYIVAEDKKGKFIADFGERPSYFEETKSSDKEFNYALFKKCYLTHKEPKLKKMQKAVLHKWDKMLVQKKKQNH